jgi:hypothetical protein
MSGGLAAVFWVLLCLRWFDDAAGLRPGWLAAVSPAALAGPALLALGAWVATRWPLLAGKDLPRTAGCLLVVALSLLVRLPFVAQGAAGAVTADGALSGLVALHARDGTAHHVFVPRVPYSGSLKSHLTAPLAAVIDPARAFALVSVLFYAAFVAAVFHLGALAGGAGAAVAAGLYAAVSPPFVTRYGLSNDGNYVEVMALGAWALWLAARAVAAPARARRTLSLAAGVLLGLAFWCHVLALVPLLAVVASVPLLVGPGGSLVPLAALAGGWALGNVPGLLWNLAHRGETFLYLLPGGPRVGGEEAPASLGARLGGLFLDQAPVLLGADFGYGGLVDGVLRAVGFAALAAVIAGVAGAVRDAWRTRAPVLVVLLAAAGATVALALLALPYLPGNARYLLPLFGPAAVLVGRAFAAGPRRAVLFLLVGASAASSMAQLPGTARADARWRELAAGLEGEGVRHCYTDFFLATKINFLSAERVVCSAKLGPTTTEYFFEYRRAVEAAPAAALVAVNGSSADRLERRLRALGVGYERRDLMKPVLLRLTRKVDPEELFPGRTFEWR